MSLLSEIQSDLKQSMLNKDELTRDTLRMFKSEVQKFEIDNMNTKNGKLVYSKTTAKKGLNKQNLLSGLLLYFQNNEDTAKDACTLIMENRPKVEKISLKRTINKAPVN